MMKQVVVVCCMLVAVGCGENAGSAANAGPVLPPVSEITCMEASLCNRPDSGPDVPMFTVLPQDYGKVLSLFDAAETDRFPGKWQALGTVTIRTAAAPKCLIALYWTDRAPGAFSIGKSYFRGGSDSQAIDTIARCYKAAQDAGSGAKKVD